jgi:hypothetical protein
MINGVGFMAWSSFYGGTIGNILAKWEELGVFSYVLPFLIIFSLIFIILNQMRLFKDNRAVNSIIALAVSFMSLQFDFVPRFFAEIFPRVGVGLAIILVILIFIGMFMDPDKPGLMIGLMVVGIIIVIVVLLSTAGSLGWSAGDWWTENIGLIIGVIIFVVVVGFIIGSGPRRQRPPMTWNPLGFGHRP